MEGTVVVLTFLQRAIGSPDELLFRLESHVKLVVDTTPPNILSVTQTPNMGAKTIAVSVQAEDSVSGIDSVFAEFSTDGGVSCSSHELYMDVGTFTDPARTYEETLGPFCAGQTVLSHVTVVDGVGNRAASPDDTIVF